ncbi:MAG: heme exporter protein CcmB [Calditrichia bacterium]
MAIQKFELLEQAWVIFQKDFRLEFRTRFAINAIVLFAVTALVVVSFSIGGAELSPSLLASLLWVVLFFSAMSGLAHIFIREEEQQTADTLRLVVKPSAVFLGKWVFNLILLYGLELIIIPLFFVFLNVKTVNFPAFMVILLSGSLGMCSVATIVAAIISKASGRGALYSVLSFPISMTILVSAINGSKLAFMNRPFLDCFTDLQILLSFSVVIITASVLLFDFIWRD